MAEEDQGYLDALKEANERWSAGPTPVDPLTVDQLMRTLENVSPIAAQPQRMVRMVPDNAAVVDAPLLPAEGPGYHVAPFEFSGEFGGRAVTMQLAAQPDLTAYELLAIHALMAHRVYGNQMLYAADCGVLRHFTEVPEAELELRRQEAQRLQDANRYAQGTVKWQSGLTMLYDPKDLKGTYFPNKGAK